jgi:hypothetical protein
MAHIKLVSALPSGEHNGLLAMHKHLLANPKDVLVAVVLLDRRRLEHDDDNGEDVPVVRVRRIEVLTDQGDADAVTRLLLREFERRTGRAVLPLDLENDLRAILDAGIEDDSEE